MSSRLKVAPVVRVRIMNIDSVSLYEILSAYQAVDRGYLPNHMPYYEYRCNNCGRNVRKFYTYAEFDTVQPECNHCGSDNLRRLISRVALAKSEESRMESMDPDRMMAGLDEEDPRSLGRFMRKMGSEMGEDLGDEFGEVVGRLESGESPESIEESMPDLAASGGGDLPGSDLGLG